MEEPGDVHAEERGRRGGQEAREIGVALEQTPCPAVELGALRFEAVHVRLDSARDEQGDGYLRCGIRAQLASGETVSSGATATDLCAAVQEAADLLEVALYRPVRPAPGAMPTAPGRFAA
jgi:hypothetical protein